MIAAILLALALIGVCVFGYFKWQAYREQTGQLGARIAALESQVQALEAENAQLVQAAQKPAAATNDDELATAAAKLYCEAEVNPQTAKPKVFTLNTISTANKKVVYANNKTFAELNASCADVAGQTGESSVYVLKKINGSWVVVDKAQEVSAEAIKLYGIPATFQ